MFNNRWTKLVERAATISTVAALLGGCGATAESDVLDPMNTEQELGAGFVVMTLNVRLKTGDDTGERAWSERVANLVSLVARRQPQILAVQELRDETIEDFYARLNAAVGNYNHVSINRGDGEWVALLWRTDRFTAVETGHKAVSNGQRDDDCGTFVDEDPKNRPIVMAKLRDRQTGFEYYAYNTHYPSKHSCERHGMSRIFASFVASRADKSAPVILMGDYNDGIEADGRMNGSFERLVTATGFANAYGAKHALNQSSSFKTPNGWDKVGRQGKMIDHILISHPDLVTGSDVDRTMFTAAGGAVNCPTVTNGACPNGTAASSLRLYSDHWAVWARIQQ